MRRYEQQKRAILAREMGRILGLEAGQEMSLEHRVIRPGQNNFNTMTVDEVNNMEIMLDPGRAIEFVEMLDNSDYTEQSLMQEAFSNKSEKIAGLDEKITLLLKNLSGLQASYEVLVNRKLNIERMRMQNELLAQDLNAIEVEVLPDASQSEKKSSK